MTSGREVTLPLVAIMTVFAIMAAGAYAKDYYVDASASGSGTGENWANAFNTIQEGIDACSGTSPDTVHVAAGTYGENIVLDSYVTLLGGYPPGGGTRDPDLNVTTIDGQAVDSVVKVSSKTGVMIDGFTIQNGSANLGGGIYCDNSSPTITNCTINGNTAQNAGVIYCYNSSPTIKNCTINGNTAHNVGVIYCCEGSPTLTDCTISGNTASGNGGGIYCVRSSPTLTDCTVSGNTAGRGGGIFCWDSSPTLTGCTVSGNTAAKYGGGGGIFCWGSSPTLTDCTVSGNTAQVSGGGICCYDHSSPTLTDCTVSDNTAADDDGGGIFCQRSSDPALSNCLIVGNSANYGGGLHCENYSGEPSSPTLTNCTLADNSASHADGGGGIYCESENTVTVANSILWGDTANGVPNEIGGPGTVTVSYSDVQGGWSGTGNIDEDPEFCSRGGDTNYDGYFLKQENDGQGWAQSERSPCVDAGDPSSDPFGGAANDEYSTAVNGFLDTNRVDMGYHYKYHGCTYIELISFEARPQGSGIVLTWETGAEIDNAGFVIYRAIMGTFDYQQVSDLIAAEGSPSVGASYSFTDSNVQAGITYNYYLVDIDTSGKWTAHGPASARLPMRLRLIELPAANCQALR